MSKYIKLDDAIHNINLEVIGRKEYTDDMKANLFFALDDLPTIDIVHCDDCSDYDTCVFDFIRANNGYCNYGERIDNE